MSRNYCFFFNPYLITEYRLESKRILSNYCRVRRSRQVDKFTDQLERSVEGGFNIDSKRAMFLFMRRELDWNNKNTKMPAVGTVAGNLTCRMTINSTSRRFINERTTFEYRNVKRKIGSDIPANSKIIAIMIVGSKADPLESKIHISMILTNFKF